MWTRKQAPQSEHRALTASRQPAPTPTHFTALLDALQALIQHLAPAITPNPALQRLLRQLHADARTQRPSSSVVDFLHAATLASLQPTPRRALPTPPTEPGLAARAAERVGTDRPTFQGRLQRARIRMRQLLSACLSAAPPECTAA